MAEVGDTSTGAGDRAAFISYASEDAALANQVVGSLERVGISCWIAPRDVEPGALYADEIVRAINESRVVVLVLSSHSVASAHVGKELERASSKDKRIFALRTDASVLPRAFEYFLSESQWIDVGPGGIETATTKLAESVRRHLGAGPAAGVNAVHTPPTAAVWRPRGLMLGIAAVAAVAIAAVAMWLHQPKQAKSSDPPSSAASTTTIAATDAPSIAVLPFVNMSSDKEQEFFADGLSEELLNQLAQIPKLRVIGRTSSFSFKGKSEDLRKIGEMLGVNHILEGSVRRSGNQLRITAQLINPADGSHLWSETYNRELRNIFEIQDEIAMAVSQKLQLTINGNGRAAGGTQNVAAYEAYVVGISKLRGTKPSVFAEAVKLFEEATRLDPNFENAWAGLLVANVNLIALVPDARDAARQRYADIAARVLSVAPDSLAAGIVRIDRAVASKDFATAFSLLRRETDSVDLFSSAALDARGQLQLALGDPLAAIESFAEARRSDPLVGMYSTRKMIAHESAGQYSLADEEYRVALAAPNVVVEITEGSALVMAMGRHDRPAIDRLLPRVIEAGPEGRLVNQIALKYLDDAPAARRELRKLIDDPRIKGQLFQQAAMTQWAGYFGDDELALVSLQRLSNMGLGINSWGMTLWRAVNQNTRRLPGFKTLVRDLGLVDYWRKTGKWNDFCKPVGADDFECH